MYITAQRVAELHGPKYGINGFLYLHGDTELARTNDGRPDIEKIAAHPPGERAESIESLRPGNNGVHSYLDVGVSDERSTEAIESALAEFSTFVPTKIGNSYRATETVHDVGLRVYLSNQALLPPELEFQSLAETVLQLLANHRRDQSHTSLRITLDETPDEWRFWSLSGDDEPSGPPASSRGRVLTIDRDTLQSYEETRGSFFPVAAESLFGMNSQELIENGGVEIVNANDEGLIWRGP
jgi:hypothetical protein